MSTPPPTVMPAKVQAALGVLNALPRRDEVWNADESTPNERESEVRACALDLLFIYLNTGDAHGS